MRGVRSREIKERNPRSLRETRSFPEELMKRGKWALRGLCPSKRKSQGRVAVLCQKALRGSSVPQLLNF